MSLLEAKTDAVRKAKCKFQCHDTNEITMHFTPCCYDGYVEEYRYI